MKIRVVISVLLLLSYVLLSGQQKDSSCIAELNPVVFKQALADDPGGMLIDVREFFEYKKSRLKNAVNIPSSGNLEFAADTLDKNSALFFYCTSGFRSKRVAKYFCGQGFQKVYSLDGGIVGWKKNKFEIDSRRGRKVASSLRSSQ